MAKWSIATDDSLVECVERNIDGWKQRCLKVEREALPICDAHRLGELELPDLVGSCVACRIAYLEAQESLLSKAEDRAKEAEAVIADIRRPLDEQMVRLNATIIRLNRENEQLLRERDTVVVEALETAAQMVATVDQITLFVGRPISNEAEFHSIVRDLLFLKAQAIRSLSPRSDMVCVPRELLREVMHTLRHTKCIDEDATKCPACAYEAQIDLLLSASDRSKP